MCHLCQYRKWISFKEIRANDIEKIQAMSFETLCNLEINLPKRFFDIQVHVLAHLVDEVSLCGPISTQHMFFLE